MVEIATIAYPFVVPFCYECSFYDMILFAYFAVVRVFFTAVARFYVWLRYVEPRLRPAENWPVPIKFGHCLP